MALASGSRVGIYEVTAKIGEGGMGEVYQARDTTLDRDVALKVLPEAFTADPDRLARFQREAKVLASLNHSNIGAIYGLEAAGETQALVLELIEGPTLADRIAEGPIPVDEALNIANQIAEALEAAHEQGIIHRDLKPANVKVKTDGTVKVLDFGLAKAASSEASGASATTSATMSLTASATQMGMVIGTAAYMAPEQAKGKPVDKRADIWAFGVVLFEMLTGQRAFGSGDVTETLAQVIMKEVDWSPLPNNVPVSVKFLLQRCLERDPRQRLRDVGEARIELERSSNGSSRLGVGEPSSLWLRVLRRPVYPVALGLVLVLVGSVLGRLIRTDVVVSGDLMRLAVTVPPAEQLMIANNVDVAISPNGRLLAYMSGLRADTFGPKKLLLQSLDDIAPTTLASGTPLYNPFFSPDSEWVGIFDLSEQSLRRVSVDGGSAIKVADVPGVLRGASWGAVDIIFATQEGGLWRVSATGGVPENLTVPDSVAGERGHHYPVILPGGKSVLFTIKADSIEDAKIAVLSLDSLETKVLLTGGSYPRYSLTGHLLYGMTGNLWAVGFDLNNLETMGEAVLVQEGVLTKPQGVADVAISDNGRLVYVPGGGEVSEGTLALVDRQGTPTELPLPLGDYSSPRFSPDGSQIAVQVTDPSGESNIFIYELTSDRLRQLTFDGGAAPIWTPGGSRVTFLAHDAIWNVAADFSEQPQLLSAASNELGIGPPNSWAPDGSVLIWDGVGDLNQIDVLEDGAIEFSSVLAEQYREVNPRFSADGDWFSYEATDAGREIYVQPYPPGSGARRRISPSGGVNPVWAGTGRELFYENSGQIWGVKIETEPTLEWETAVPLFENRWRLDNGDLNNYDVSPDGQSFVFVDLLADSGQLNQINIVLNWFEELNERVPVP